MNLFQSKKNLLLLAASVIVWLGTCLLAMHWNTVYDGAVGGFPTYLWVFAPVALIFNIFMNSRPNNPDGRDHSRWAQALLVFLVALMLFIALLSGMNPLYEISFWWIAALIVLSFIGLLIGKLHEPPSAGGFAAAVRLYHLPAVPVLRHRAARHDRRAASGVR